jgi:SAM-dependent methyltransferase
MEADMFDALPFQDEFFDAVYSYQALNHGRLSQIRRLFDEIYRVLKPGGIFSVKTFQLESFRAKKAGKNIYAEDDKRYRVLAKQTFVPMQGDEKGLDYLNQAVALDSLTFGAHKDLYPFEVVVGNQTKAALHRARSPKRSWPIAISVRGKQPQLKPRGWLGEGFFAEIGLPWRQTYL